MRGPVDPAMAQQAHTELQRALLALLAEHPGLPMPAHADMLLGMAIEFYPEVAPFANALHPQNVERALVELSNEVPHAVRVESAARRAQRPHSVTAASTSALPPMIPIDFRDFRVA